MRSALLVLSTIAAVACGGDPLPLRDCTPSASVPCACVGGSTGAQLCDAAGHLEACVCPDASPGGDVVDSAAADVVDVALDVPGLDVAVPLDVPAIDVPAIDAPDVAVSLDAPDVDHQVTDAAPDAVDANNGDASADASADVADCNTASDPANCGACGRVCSLPNTPSACADGVCRVPVVGGGYQCAAGFANCDRIDVNGCEIDLQNNPRNCRACNHQCNGNHGTAGCSRGACTIVCSPGWCDRNGTVDDGCETAC